MANRDTHDRTRRSTPGGPETYRPGVEEDGQGRIESRAGTGAGAKPEIGEDGRSLGQLIRELGDESSRLVREEVALAKAEMREKVQVYERNAVKMAIGGVLLLGALFVLLVAVNRGLTALLELFMAVEIAVWLAPLILAGVFALIGWSMLKGGQKAIRREGVTPHRTVETLREERDWAKREAKEVRHGGR